MQHTTQNSAVAQMQAQVKAQVQAQVKAQRTVNKLMQRIVKQHNIRNEGCSDDTLYASCEDCYFVFTTVLKQLNVSQATNLHALATATGQRDVSVKFTYNAQQVSLCTCYSSC